MAIFADVICHVWHTYLRAYGHIAAEFFTTSGTTTPYYFVGDHLYSTAALSDANGNRAQYNSYDSWGLSRNPNGSDFATGCPAIHPQSQTLRLFTGQEDMLSYCLVNLNGQMYDTTLGRMLSADPTVPDPANGQAFDRYSYVLNNPLAYVDPTGHAGCIQRDCQPILPINGWQTGSSFPCYQGGGCITPMYGDDWLGFMNGGLIGSIPGANAGGLFSGGSGAFNWGGGFIAYTGDGGTSSDGGNGGTTIESVTVTCGCYWVPGFLE